MGYDARLSLEFAYIVEIEMKISGVPDILEVQDYSGIGYYTLQKKHLLYPLFKDLKIVLTMHAPSFLYLDYNQVPLYNFPAYWTGQMEKASIKMADLLISPSNYLINELESYIDLKQNNPIRLFNPFQNEESVSKIPEYKQGDLVFFGKLTPQKGCLEMLSYLKKMWDNGFEYSLTIIGGGNHFFYPIQEDMIVYIKRIYLDYISRGFIKFEGNMPPEKLRTRLLNAHVIITPSIVDNLPYAILEAMAMGKVVLASANGGHTEIINHEMSGFIFKHEVSNSFENELNKILKLDSKSLKEIAKNAQKDVELLTSYTTILKQKTDYFLQLIKSNQEENNFPFIESISKPSKHYSPNRKSISRKLSIVIPYYNMGDYIEDTLNSLKEITYDDYEVLLIDDGSNESKSITKIKEIEEKYDITVYRKSNDGLSKTRNFGAEISNGEFLAFLDADDTVSPNYYTKAIEILSNYQNVSFVGCWAQYFGESNDTWPTFNPEPPYLLLHNVINSSALIYKRKDFLAFGKNDPELIYGMEDYDSVISMVKNGARGVALPELWWQYRIRKNSMAQSFTKNKELYLYRIINKKHKSFFQNYGDELVNLLNHNGSGLTFNNPTWSSSNSGKGKFWLKNEKIIKLIKKNKVLRSLAKKVYQNLNK